MLAVIELPLSMDYQIRQLKEEDYEMLYEWWKGWRWSVPPPRNILPDNLNEGIMVQHQNTDVCAGFLYSTSSSSMFYMEFIVSNPNVKDKDVRSKSLEYLIQGLLTLAEAAGASVVFTVSRNPSVLKKYEENGFIQGSKNSTEMVFNF